MMRVSQDKYDFGYLRGSGVDWYGPVVGSGYYGPPSSLWWQWFIPLIFKASFLGAVGMVSYG
jgi:hypothetical protein